MPKTFRLHAKQAEVDEVVQMSCPQVLAAATSTQCCIDNKKLVFAQLFVGRLELWDRGGVETNSVYV